MKTQDIPALKEKVMGMLPITQAEIWKNLGINSKDASVLISIMVDEHLIKKTKTAKTFLIEKINGDGQDKVEEETDQEYAKDEKVTFKDVLLSGRGEFSPCCGCLELVCNADTCRLLTKWIEDIQITEEKEKNNRNKK